MAKPVSIKYCCLQKNDALNICYHNLKIVMQVPEPEMKFHVKDPGCRYSAEEITQMILDEIAVLAEGWLKECPADAVCRSVYS
jgi:hypothetical protein